MSSEPEKLAGGEHFDSNKANSGDGSIARLNKIIENEHLNGNKKEGDKAEIKLPSNTNNKPLTDLKNNGLDSDDGELGEL